MYIFVAVIAVAGGSYYFFTRGATMAGAIYLLGSFVTTLFFGVRWFTSSGVNNTGSWPPVINVCPDFLSIYTTASGKVCVDTIGVAGPGGITKFQPGTTAPTPEQIFDLKLSSTTTRAADICAECKTKKVAWEGIYDGTTCTNTNPPKPAA